MVVLATVVVVIDVDVSEEDSVFMLFSFAEQKLNKIKNKKAFFIFSFKYTHSQWQNISLNELIT